MMLLISSESVAVAIAALPEKNESPWAVLALEIAALKHVLVDDPIPGVPRIPGETDPKLAGPMVMQDGIWYFPDRAMAEFTGEEPGNVNRRGDRSGLILVPANRSGIIGIAWHYAPYLTKKGGKDNQLHGRETALALLNVTTNFTQDWTREKSIAAVTEAFDWG